MNKRILIVILIVIVVAVLGAIIFSQAGNGETQISFLSPAALNSGDNVTFQLTDARGNALSDKTVVITYVKDGESQNFTIVTDSEGKGYLTLTNEEAGVRNVIVNFAGDDDYSPCNATQTITIGQATSEETYSDSSSQDTSGTTTSQSGTEQSSDDTSSSSDSDLNYDSDLNVYYDNDGVVRGGQNDGASYDDVKNNAPQVDAEGNLV